MVVMHGDINTKYGPGVDIKLTGDEVATAIDAYLVAMGLCIRGPRSITVNGYSCEDGLVFVDPSGFVIKNGKKIDGRGPS